MRLKIRVTPLVLIGITTAWSALCTVLSVAICSYEYDFVLAKYLVLPMFLGSLVTLPFFLCLGFIAQKARRGRTGQY